MSKDPKINPAVYEMPHGIPVRVEKRQPSASQQRALAAAVKACDDEVSIAEMASAVAAYLAERRPDIAREFGELAGYLIDEELLKLRAK